MPKSAKKGSAKSAKGKISLTLKLPSGESLPFDSLLTDTIAILKTNVQKALDEAELKRQEECEDKEGLPDCSEETRGERAELISLSFKDEELSDPEATCQSVGIATESEIELIPPAPQNGSGRFRFKNNAVYEGEWQLFKGIRFRHGNGSFTHCGEVYEGNWAKDEIMGVGKYTFNSGACYEGNFESAKFQGEGVYTWADGSSYKGSWKSNVMEGKGTFTTASGDRYEGPFKNNKFINDQGHWLPTPHTVNYT